jgi:hypothetical protein
VRWTENSAEVLAFIAAFPMSGDPREAEKNRMWRHVYLARYMRLTPREIEEMPLSLLAKYVATLSELIKKEAGPTRMAETDYV